jgi:hypothetical protein
MIADGPIVVENNGQMCDYYESAVLATYSLAKEDETLVYSSDYSRVDQENWPNSIKYKSKVYGSIKSSESPYGGPKLKVLYLREEIEIKTSKNKEVMIFSHITIALVLFFTFCLALREKYKKMKNWLPLGGITGYTLKFYLISLVPICLSVLLLDDFGLSIYGTILLLGVSFDILLNLIYEELKKRHNKK